MAQHKDKMTKEEAEAYFRSHVIFCTIPSDASATGSKQRKEEADEN